MAKAIAEIDGKKLYYIPELAQSYLQVACQYWACPIIKRDMLKGLYPVFPDKSFSFFSRFKSLIGIYKRLGVIGFYSLQSNRIYIIISHFVGFRAKVNPAVASVTAHEYQHAAFSTNPNKFVSVTKDYLVAWYKQLMRFLLKSNYSQKMDSFVESTMVPTLIKSEKAKHGKLALALWEKLNQHYGEVTQIVTFLKGGSISTNDYINYIFLPCCKAYLSLFTEPSNFKYVLHNTMYYQEFLFPSEVQAIRASVYPKDKLVLSNAQFVKLSK